MMMHIVEYVYHQPDHMNWNSQLLESQQYDWMCNLIVTFFGIVGNEGHIGMGQSDNIIYKPHIQ